MPSVARSACLSKKRIKIFSARSCKVMPEEDNKTENKFVETYAEDMARVIKDDHEGLVKKIIHEQELKDLEKKNFSPESKKNKIYMLTSLAFLFAALTVLSFFV